MSHRLICDARRNAWIGQTQSSAIYCHIFCCRCASVLRLTCCRNENENENANRLEHHFISLIPFIILLMRYKLRIQDIVCCTLRWYGFKLFDRDSEIMKNANGFQNESWELPDLASIQIYSLIAICYVLSLGVLLRTFHFIGTVYHFRMIPDSVP